VADFYIQQRWQHDPAMWAESYWRCCSASHASLRGTGEAVSGPEVLLFAEQSFLIMRRPGNTRVFRITWLGLAPLLLGLSGRDVA